MKTAMNTFLFAFLGIIVAFAISMAVLFISSFVLIRLGEKTEAKEKADCILVPGARIGGRALDFRLNGAAKLYENGFADKIIVTGAQGEDEPTTEAFYMANYLVEKGIPIEDIFLEDESTSTYENFAFSKDIMISQGFSDTIIVTNDYHAYRCGKMAELLNIKAQIQPVQKPKGIYLRGPFRETLAVMWYYFLNKF